jgi:hypothetical protein
VTVHNIRNFDYRTETDFTPRYYDKTFDLNKLDSVDIIASYWAGDTIAHIIVSFGFAGTDFLAVSIETRRERNESYSPIAGFFQTVRTLLRRRRRARSAALADELQEGSAGKRLSIASAPAPAPIGGASFSTMCGKSILSRRNPSFTVR